MIILLGKKEKDYRNTINSSELNKIIKYLHDNYDKFSFGFSKDNDFSNISFRIHKAENYFDIRLKGYPTFEEFKEQLKL